MRQPVNPVVAAIIIVVVIALVIVAYNALEKSAPQSNPHQKGAKKGGIGVKAPAGKAPGVSGGAAEQATPSGSAEGGQPGQ